jgi:hypothetical protein
MSTLVKSIVESVYKEVCCGRRGKCAGWQEAPNGGRGHNRSGSPGQQERTHDQGNREGRGAHVDDRGRVLQSLGLLGDSAHTGRAQGTSVRRDSDDISAMLLLRSAL